jgi:hypothetical protein
MPLYRKKPVVVEVMQFPGPSAELEGIATFLKFDEWLVANSGTKCRYAGSTLRIPTLEGMMTAHPGDYIIKGVAGELYPCKPEIFKQTYEAA